MVVIFQSPELDEGHMILNLTSGLAGEFLPSLTSRDAAVCLCDQNLYSKCLVVFPGYYLVSHSFTNPVARRVTPEE